MLVYVLGIVDNLFIYYVFVYWILKLLKLINIYCMLNF